MNAIIYWSWEEFGMAKIISVLDDKVKIGENGELIEVRREDVSFEPRVGDEVDIYRNENEISIVLTEKSNSNSGTLSQEGSGININLSQNQTAANPVHAPTYVQNGKVVNKIAYILCACLVGGFGVHKFLTDKIGMGIVYLIFCWTFIPGLIGFIEGLIAISKTADVNGNIVV